MWVDFDQIKRNIENETYEFIGSGSGRHVFDLGNGYVVKVARNRRGYAQNKAEYEISSTKHFDILAKIIQVSDDNKFLIMERAELIKTIRDVWEYFNVKSNLELLRLKELTDIYAEHKIILQDLRRPENWGFINGRPVIIDYGFTRRVKKKYYSFF